MSPFGLVCSFHFGEFQQLTGNIVVLAVFQRYSLVVLYFLGALDGPLLHLHVEISGG